MTRAERFAYYTMNPPKKVTKEQKHIIVDFMVKNNDFLVGPFLGEDGSAINKKWIELVDLLHSCGAQHPKKSLDGWKQTWRDMKKMAKTKYSAIKKCRNTTGSGPSGQTLSELEEKIIAIIGKETLDGIGIEELGFNNPREKSTFKISIFCA